MAQGGSRPKPAQPAFGVPLRAPAAGKAITVLYVSAKPDSEVREGLLLLRRKGYRVKMVGVDPCQPVVLLGQEVTVVMIEVDGCDSPGYQLCSAVRARSPLLILMIVRNPTLESLLRALECGADMYVVAPFQISELPARLHALLRRHPHVPHPA
jgi:DNA-binding response OmpR family regulator